MALDLAPAATHVMAMAVLLLDVMDTLVWDPFRNIPDHFGLSWEAFFEAKHPTAWQEFERGELTSREYYRKMFADGRQVDGAALEAMLQRGYRFLPGIEQLLAELTASGHELYALSNYPVWFELIEAKLLLSRFLSWRFVSCRTGARKPDARAYLGVGDVLKRDLSTCLFVDDRASNVDAARQAGMPALLFEGADGLRDSLTQAGLIGEHVRAAAAGLPAPFHRNR